MGPTSALVLLAVIWFMILFIVLPLGLKTQGDVGQVVPGTHAGAPANLNLKRKLKIVTLWAVPVWILIAGTILSGVISVRDLDWFHRMSTPAMELQATDGN